MRYKIAIEYFGTNFCGWQRQNIAKPSIQETIENAIFHFTNINTEIVGAGRTDAGVHAISQTAHFDISKNYLPCKVQSAINHFLYKKEIRVINCEYAQQNFHARFSAKMRHYLYRIVIRNADPILDANRCWIIKNNLDIDSMISASKYLIGTHDFTSFRASICQAKSPIKTIDNIEITLAKNLSDETEIRIYVSAKSFLHHMVRNIVGTIVDVGNGKIPPQEVERILIAKNRNKARITAPSHGLYLYKIEY